MLLFFLLLQILAGIRSSIPGRASNACKALELRLDWVDETKLSTESYPNWMTAYIPKEGCQTGLSRRFPVKHWPGCLFIAHPVCPPTRLCRPARHLWTPTPREDALPHDLYTALSTGRSPSPSPVAEMPFWSPFTKNRSCDTCRSLDNADDYDRDGHRIRLSELRKSAARRDPCPACVLLWQAVCTGLRPATSSPDAAFESILIETRPPNFSDPLVLHVFPGPVAFGKTTQTLQLYVTQGTLEFFRFLRFLSRIPP